MTYPRRLLTEGEEIVREFRPHWRLLVIPAFWAAVGLAVVVVAWVMVDQTVVNWVVTGLGAAFIFWFGLRPFVHWWFTHYILTSERLIRRSGFIARRGVEIPLENINDVRFAQTVLERVLRSGDLLIESAGEMGQSRFSDIPDPEAFQSLLYRIREERTKDLGVSHGPDPASQLEKLARLHRDGVLTDEEFAEKKQRLLDLL